MIILGIDPGSLKAGYGVIKKNGNKFEYISSGVLKFKSDKDFFERLNDIYNFSLQLIIDYAPNEIAIESLIHVKNVNSLAKLAQARGAMAAAFAKTHSGRLYEYSPNLIKSSVTSDGHCSKEGMQKTVSMILGKRDFKTDDESDALGIAICHALIGGQNFKKQIPKVRSIKDIYKDLEK